MHDHAADQMPVAEKARGALCFAGLQKPADVRRADGLAVQLDLIDHVAAHLQFGAGLPQKFGRARAAVAKAEIVPADDVAGVQLADEIIGDKIAPRHVHHDLVKMREDDLVDAE